MTPYQYLEILKTYPLTLKITDAQGFIDTIHYQVKNIGSGTTETIILTNEDGTTGPMTLNDLKNVITHARAHGYSFKLED